MSTTVSPNPPNFSRPLSANPTGGPVQSTRSSSGYFTPSDSVNPSIHQSLDAPPMPSKPSTRQPKPMGLGMGRPSASAESSSAASSKDKPAHRGGGFGAPGTGTAAKLSRKRSRADLVEEPSPAVAGRLVPNQDEKAGFDNAVEFDPDQDDGESDDDEGGGKKARTASGAANARRKIQISYIEDKARRHITFSKRKAGIMKKAFELSTLTGTQVLLLVVSETGLVYTFTTTKLQPLVTRDEGKNLIQACLNAPDGEGPDGGPPGTGGMTTGARSKSTGGPGSTIRHKDDVTSSNGYESSMPSPTSPYDDIPIPPIPSPLPTSPDPVTSRRPSAALPKRGRQPSMSAAKAKRTQGAAAKAAAQTDRSDEDELAQTELERNRQRGMDFAVADSDDEDVVPGGPLGANSTARSMSGIAPTAQQIAEYAVLEERDLSARIRAHVMGSSERIPELPPLSAFSALGGLQQYDDYSTQSADVDVSHKLEDHDEDDMHAYMSVGASASSGMPGHHLQHQQQQHHQQHLQPPQQQQQQHHQGHPHQRQQVQAQQYRPDQWGVPQPQYAQQRNPGGYSPGHMTLSPSPGAPFEPGPYAAGGHLEGTW